MRVKTTWITKLGSYVRVSARLGLDVLIAGTNKYLNFGSAVGSSGYGFRDNNGVMQYKNSGEDWNNFSGGVGGPGDVVGPASATDNAIARFNTTTGKAIQDSLVTIDDTTGKISFTAIVDAAINILKTGTTLFGFDMTGITTESGTFRFFRSTNTTGETSVQVLRGDGSSTINHSLAGKGNSYLAGNSGRVGIGVTTPSAKLHVANDADGVTPTAIFDTNTNAQPVIISRTGGLTERMDVGVTDNEAIFNHIQDETDTTNHNTVFDTTTSATGKHAFVIKLNGAIKFFFDLLNTRLGVGTSNPTEALDVVGNGKFSGNVSGAAQTYDADAWEGSNILASQGAVQSEITKSFYYSIAL